MLRPYQASAVMAGIKQLAYNRPGILCLPVGSGKSHIIAAIAKQCENAIILQPNKELVEQNYDKLKQAFDGLGGTKAGEELGVYSSSLNKHEIKRYTFATIGSVYRHIEDFKGFTTVIIDECDTVNPSQGMYKKFLEGIGCKRVIGLTATPYRFITKNKTDYKTQTISSTSLLRSLTNLGFFTDIAYNISTDFLMQEGYLSPLKYFRDAQGEYYTKVLKLSSTSNDYTSDSLSIYGEQSARYTAELARRALKKGFCKKMLLFAVDVKTAEAIGETLGAPVVTGMTSKKEREKIVREFKKAKTGILVNVATMTVGVDFPDLDCILLARPTNSPRLFTQICGRGTRLDPENPNKVCKVVDITGTVKKFGDIAKMEMRKDSSGHWQLFGETGQLTEAKAKTIYIRYKRKGVKGV